MLLPDTQFGHYQILSLVGEGTQGVIYKALDVILDRYVALKVIHESLADSSEYRVTLANEAKKAAQIDSQYVVKVWEYAEIDNHPFISYEFVAGQDFKKATYNLHFNEKIDLAKKNCRRNQSSTFLRGYT